MPALADIQTGIRNALVNGGDAAMTPPLRGGANPRLRLAIHQRHYATSLTRAVVERFPATVWLVGPDLVTDAARSFIRAHPPTAPCLAEYGASFPHHLGAHPGAGSLPYLTQFAELEWHLGWLSLATDDSVHTRLLRLDWALDELIGLYLTGREPEQFFLRQEHVWLELRGLRGELELNRVTEAEFTTRRDR